MAKITIDSFRGEAPRLTPRALPPNAAQVAINARLQSGDLESWRGMLETASLANDAQTIYLLNDAWLSWESDVDVARGPVAGDTTYRVYLTGPDEYDQPRFTNYALATTGSAPYPVATRPLGVPGPVSEPTLVIGVDPSPTTFSVDVLDEGDVLDTEWITSPTGSGGGFFSQVHQDATGGNPDECYRLQYDESVPGGGPYAYRNFGIANATVIHASTDFQFVEDDDVQRRAALCVANDVTGHGCCVLVYGGNTLSIRNATQLGGWWGDAVVDNVSCGLAHGTWYTMDVVLVVNANGTQTVTAQVFQGSAQIATVTATSVFTLGDYCVISAASGADANPRYATVFDNIHVQASGSNGYTPVNIATSYVYTFVNDLGEESVPSLPSSTIQRPDGVSVAVTTATAIPSGISNEYGIATKRIYRAATGNTGTVFRFVAEIDLETETYEDVLTDEQLGEVLESEEYDLPPDDLRGIRILPNGVMAGFSKNQLCLSAQNRPHAWPVGNRLTVDTDIVAISNIDTTVVVGTESFVYSASGNDPSAYSMSQPGARQACVSKRSMRYMNDQVGVVFASPDGLMAMTGPTTVRNVTEGVFTRRQWQDLVPETIQAAVHDDIYFFSYGTNSSASGGMFMLDLKASGFGLVRLDYFANAMFSDPLTDKLYMVQTDAEPEAADWLGYDDSDVGPIMREAFIDAYVAIATPIAFAADLSFGHTSYEGNDGTLYLPLFGGDATAPVLVENVTWFPSTEGAAAPVIGTVSPTDLWTGFTWILSAVASGVVVLVGPTGTTVITIDIEEPGGGDYYEGATLEYLDTPTPPSATVASLPYSAPAAVVEDAATWFVFTLASASGVNLYTDSATCETHLALYAATGGLVMADQGSAGGGNSELAVTLPAGTYYLALAGYHTLFGFGFDAQPFGTTESGTCNLYIEQV